MARRGGVRPVRRGVGPAAGRGGTRGVHPGRGSGRAAAAALLGAGATLLARPLLARTALPRHPRWTRPNYRGATLRLDGAAVGAGLALAGALLGRRPRAAVAVALATAAGLYDDLAAPATETAGDKGLAGHLAAVRAGRVSGGAVKVAVIGTAAWWAAGPEATGPLDRAVRATATAATANLVNLLDLRPGRAGKLALALAGPAALAGDVASASVLGAVLVALPGDLGERTMLGDSGANALGAALGLAAAGSRRMAPAAAVLGVAAALASERVSFSRVVDTTPALRRLDALGRRDVAGGPGVAAHRPVAGGPDAGAAGTTPRPASG